jgi:hypothetical protein
MNLFRSEEHVSNWSLLNPDSTQSVMPISDWAYVMGAGIFSRRLESDYHLHEDAYFDEMYERLAELGRTGPFWQ